MVERIVGFFASLALAVAPTMTKHLVDEVRAYRRKRAKKESMHLPYGPELNEADADPMYFELKRAFEGEKWETLYAFGVAYFGLRFPPEKRPERLPEPLRSRALNWVGVAASHTGRWEESKTIIEGVVDECETSAVLVHACSYLAHVFLRFDELPKALESIDRALKIDAGEAPILLNAMCVYSRLEQEKPCRKYAQELKRRYGPDLADPDGKLRKVLEQDPDLEWFRSTASYAKLFGPGTFSWTHSPIPPVALAAVLAIAAHGDRIQELLRSVTSG